MTNVVTIVKSFGFSAAHFFPNMPEDHPYRRMHGHTFKVELALTGIPNPQSGWVQDFDQVNTAISTVRETLDHNCLNDIPGLELPSLENISIWLWERLKGALPALSCVTVSREGNGEACHYTGPIG
jgi:6-pyruvoyltetrahydropterin/6-carboxytetrahydropterin synthase